MVTVEAISNTVFLEDLSPNSIGINTEQKHENSFFDEKYRYTVESHHRITLISVAL